MYRRARVLVAIAAVLFVPASTALAQDPGPQAGTWGAEASTFSSASLLRFRSASSAWLVGVYAAVARVTENEPNLGGGETTVTDIDFNTQLRLGFRRYGPSRDRLRSFSTISVLGGGGNGSFSKTWNVGASGELGAAYFFSPHVSLGVSGELALQYQDFDAGDFGGDRRALGLSFPGFRLLRAVYF